jgi:hypothetical protein
MITVVIVLHVHGHEVQATVTTLGFGHELVGERADL